MIIKSLPKDKMSSEKFTVNLTNQGQCPIMKIEITSVYSGEIGADYYRVTHEINKTLRSFGLYDVIKKEYGSKCEYYIKYRDQNMTTLASNHINDLKYYIIISITKSNDIEYNISAHLHSLFDCKDLGCPRASINEPSKIIEGPAYLYTIIFDVVRKASAAYNTDIYAYFSIIFDPDGHMINECNNIGECVDIHDHLINIWKECGTINLYRINCNKYTTTIRNKTTADKIVNLINNDNTEYKITATLL